MRKLIVGVSLGLALLLPCAASAQFFVGARLGYSFVGGDLYKDQPIKDSTKGMVPVQVDFGIDIEKAVALGVYGSWGYTLVDEIFLGACTTGDVDCTGMNVRLGVQATLHAPVGTSKVWGGALLGWEQQQYKISATDGSGDYIAVAYRGVEAGLQGGIDFATSGSFRWGPFVSASMGEFTSRSLDASGTGWTDPGFEKARHTWVNVGLRGVFGL